MEKETILHGSSQTRAGCVSCGWVKAHKGTYHDAIHVKKSRVSLMLVEATGAISPRSLTVVGYHSRRARGARGRDSTKYGKSRASTTNYYIHHVQRIGAGYVRDPFLKP